MSKLFGSWLSGPRAAVGPAQITPSGDAPEPGTRPDWPGQRLGLPERGPGSVATLGTRGLALAVDAVLAALIAWAFTAPNPPLNWSLVPWFLITVVTVALFGFTPGMAALGIRVARVDGSAMVGPLRAVPRTILVFPILLAIICDADGRGIHDRLTGTIVLRMR